jgi:chromosomal replication initiator protein
MSSAAGTSVDDRPVNPQTERSSFYDRGFPVIHSCGGFCGPSHVTEAIKPVDEAEVLWTACAETLRATLSDAVWLTSFNAAIPVSLDNNRFVLAVPSSVFRDRIESRYLGVLRDSLAAAGVSELEVVIEVRPVGASDAPLPADAYGSNGTGEHRTAPGVGTGSDAAAASAPAESTSQSPGSVFINGVNPRYTFEAFVTGTSNRFAHAAALAVAETPARSYNPLFIYGEAGLGKTHLLQAIAHYVWENYPSYVVRYVTTESFLNEYVDTIRTGDWTKFKSRYREVDVLLLDDIQFIEGREGLQEEFFHTFNHLHQANKQIVLSSDRPPDAFATLEDRLRSRFKWGLTTEINPPDIETRLAILRKKAESERQPVPPPADVLEFIATHVTNNIRELEGALIRVTAYASLTKETLTADLAAKVLDDVIADSRPRPITPEVILEATSQMFNFPIEEIRGKSRRRPLVTARQTSMYVFRQLTDMSYPAIAREFGGRDHTTVIHAVDKIEALMQERRQVYDQVTELIRIIRNDR